MKTKTAPAMKDGQDAVMQRWLMSAQKESCNPSVMTSRLPSRITRGLGVRSPRLRSICLDSPSACAKPFDRQRRHAIIE
jgi:hypothetical protein